MVNIDVRDPQTSPPRPRVRPLPKYQRIMSLDLEYTRFYGEPIALGLSIQEIIPLGEGEWTGGETGYWFTLIDHHQRPCEFVTEHVLPVITQPYSGVHPTDPLTRDYTNQKWHATHDILASIGFRVVTHVPLPIETEFLSTAHKARADHPFPIIDVCSMILGSGYQGDPTELDAWWKETIGDLPDWYVPHHPLADARLAGAAYWCLMGGKYHREQS